MSTMTYGMLCLEQVKRNRVLFAQSGPCGMDFNVRSVPEAD